MRIGDIMFEVIDQDTSVKMMALPLCKILYQKSRYVIYAIRREKSDVNLFVSKLVENSQGYAMDDSFSCGEKEMFDSLVEKLINLVPLKEIEDLGFSMILDISLTGTQYYCIEKCYISSIPLTKLKEIMKYYSFVRKDMFDSPVLGVQEDKKVLAEGAVGNILFILFGVVVLIFCLVMIFMVIFKK